MMIGIVAGHSVYWKKNPASTSPFARVWQQLADIGRFDPLKLNFKAFSK
jgi:hypothetical protein